MSIDRLITTREAAERLHVTPRTIARQVQGGKLTPASVFPLGRGAFMFDAEEIDKIAASKSEAK